MNDGTGDNDDNNCDKNGKIACVTDHDDCNYDCDGDNDDNDNVCNDNNMMIMDVIGDSER
jgi:hypothetical protein